jgi:hypothetical protein
VIQYSATYCRICFVAFQYGKESGTICTVHTLLKERRALAVKFMRIIKDIFIQFILWNYLFNH